MRWTVALLLVRSMLLTSLPYCFAQDASQIGQFTVTNASRLHALATLGRITNSSLLIEAGDMSFLEEPITISEHQKSFDQLAGAILSGSEDYEVRRRGALSIIYPLRPKKPRNRILTLQLGDFSFKGKSVSSLNPNLAFRIREVTGCHPQGFAYAGPLMDIGIPDFNLPSATFEQIIEQTAKAPTPTMWIVSPDSGQSGCISDAESRWQVGTYNNNSAFPYAFRETIGSILTP